MPQAQRMADFMHGLFERTLEEHVRIGLLAVKFGTQPMHRNDCRALLFVGVAKHETLRGFVEIEFGEREQHAVMLGVRAQQSVEQRVREELLTRRIERRLGNDQRAFDAAGEQKTLFQAEREAIHEACVERIDRDDVQATIHLGPLFRHPSAENLSATAKGAKMIVGIGIDLAEVARFRFDERALAWFARKVYTEHEMSFALRKRLPQERLAGFFAAKEATRKAFGHAILWQSVGVEHERSGRPTIALYGAASRLLEERGIARIHLSITHERATAAAVVILES